MIDARNTYRVVSSTINDFSDGQLLNLKTIVQLYRGNTDAISQAGKAHKQALKEQFEIVKGHYVVLAKELEQLSVDLKNEDIFIPETIDFSNIDNPQTAKEIYKSFEKPAPKVNDLITSLEKEIAKITAQVVREEIEKKTATAKMKPFKDQLNKLNKPLKAYQTVAAEFLKELKQRISDWKKLLEHFPENKYVNVEGLCKIVDLEKVKENDFSLNPGRYVGYTIFVDEDYDYKTRITEIKNKLIELNKESNNIMVQIKSFEL